MAYIVGFLFILIPPLLPLIFIAVVLYIGVKTYPKHPKPNPRRGSDVGCIDYLLGNWDPDEEDEDWYPGKTYGDAPSNS